MHNISAGVDLAKDEIQVCTSKKNKVQSNDAMTPESEGSPKLLSIISSLNSHFL